jgi:hypothetical protein
VVLVVDKPVELSRNKHAVLAQQDLPGRVLLSAKTAELRKLLCVVKMTSEGVCQREHTVKAVLLRYEWRYFPVVVRGRQWQGVV